MDSAALSVRIVGSVLLFFAVKSGVKHVRDDFQSQNIQKNSKPQGIIAVLTLIETGMDRCTAFFLKYTGILFLLHFITFIFSYVESFFLLIIKYVVSPVLKCTGILFLVRAMMNAVSNLSQDTSSKDKGPEKPPSSFSIITEKALNKLLLYL